MPPRVKKTTASPERSSRLETGSNSARTQRMLREMGVSTPSANPGTDGNAERNARDLGIFLKAQVEVERRLRSEAKKLADAVKKAWEEAEARTRAEIEFRIRAVRKVRKEADARLEIARHARENAERKTQEMIDFAHRVHGAAISQALSEMMARVRAEQQTVTEERVRAAAEKPAEDELAELAGQNRVAAYKAFFVPRNRSPY